VRFDPRVKKGEEDDDPETVARRTAIAAAKADNEGLDILGRKRDVKAGPR
jgi:hypothetical protein